MKLSVLLTSVTIRDTLVEPLIQYIVPAMLGVTATILLIAGGRLLKPAIGMCGFMVGAGAGFLIAPAISIQISPFIIAGIFGISFAFLCVFIAKFAILVILGTSCAIVTPYLTWQFAGLGDGTQLASDIAMAAMTTEHEEVSTPEQTIASPFSAEKIFAASFSNVWEKVNSTVASARDRVNAAWSVIPTGSRLILVGSAITGLLLGLLIATFMPFTASAIVTASFGSWLLLFTLRDLISMEWIPNALTQMSPSAFATAVAVIAIAGIALQLTLFKHPPDATPEKAKKK